MEARDEPAEHARSLIETVLRLLRVAQEQTINSPSLYPARYKGELNDIINLYQQPLTPKEEEDLGKRCAALIARQRMNEREYFALKEEELKAIINLITGEIKGTVAESEEFSREMTRSMKGLRDAADVSDIRQLREKISTAVALVAEHLESRKRQEQERVQALEEQIDILCSQLGAAEMESKTDGLTALYNRRAFDDQIRMEVSFARRLGRDLSLVMCDIDHFKQINDSYGHQAGDQILKYMASLLIKEFFRKNDFVARYGGEEFVVLLPQTKMEGATRAAARLCKNVAGTSFPAGSKRADTTISAGVVQYSQGESASVFVSRADKALYQAKAEGRNRAVGAELPAG